MDKSASAPSKGDTIRDAFSFASIDFPTGIVWAFNSNYIDIKDVGASVSHVEVSVGGLMIEVALYRGAAHIDISRLIQLTFDTPDKVRAKTISGYVACDDIIIENSQFTLYAIWGGIQLGERFGTFGAFNRDREKVWFERNVQCFVNFPFSLNTIVVPGTMRVRTDNDGYGEPISIDETAFRELTIGTDIIPGERLLVIRQDPTDAKDTSTFDDTFDYTFHLPSELTSINKLWIRHETEGCYLRWIDHFGFVQYYLFDKGDVSLNITPSDYGTRIEREYAGVHYNAGKRVLNTTSVTEYSVCASNLNKETLGYVADILTSPIVDLYLGTTGDGSQLWIPVCVSGGTYKYGTNHKYLQDLEITITLPLKNAQTI